MGAIGSYIFGQQLVVLSACNGGLGAYMLAPDFLGQDCFLRPEARHLIIGRGRSPSEEENNSPPHNLSDIWFEIDYLPSPSDGATLKVGNFMPVTLLIVPDIVLRSHGIPVGPK